MDDEKIEAVDLNNHIIGGSALHALAPPKTILRIHPNGDIELMPGITDEDVRNSSMHFGPGYSADLLIAYALAKALKRIETLEEKLNG